MKEIKLTKLKKKQNELMERIQKCTKKVKTTPAESDETSRGKL